MRKELIIGWLCGCLLSVSMLHAAELHLRPVPATAEEWRWQLLSAEAIQPGLTFAFEREDGSCVLPTVAVIDSTLWILSLDRECVQGGEALILHVERKPR
jgi:hypothetical protein